MAHQKNYFGSVDSRVDFELHRNPPRAYVFVGGMATAATAKKFALLRAHKDLTVTAVRWIPQAAVTGAATDNFALGVINAALDGTGTTAVTTVKTYASGTNSVALDIEAFTLSATAANLDIDEGEVLALDRTVNGTGLAMPEGIIEVEFEFREIG